MFSDDMCKHLFDAIDQDHTGKVAYREFLSWLQLDDELELEAQFHGNVNTATGTAAPSIQREPQSPSLHPVGAEHAAAAALAYRKATAEYEVGQSPKGGSHSPASASQSPKNAENAAVAAAAVAAAYRAVQSHVSQSPKTALPTKGAESPAPAEAASQAAQSPANAGQTPQSFPHPFGAEKAAAAAAAYRAGQSPKSVGHIPQNVSNPFGQESTTVTSDQKSSSGAAVPACASRAGSHSELPDVDPSGKVRPTQTSQAEPSGKSPESQTPPPDDRELAAMLIQRKVRGHLEREPSSTANEMSEGQEPARSLSLPSAADAAAGSPTQQTSPVLRPQADAAEVPDGAGRETMENDDHLQLLEAEAAATERAALEIQRRMRGHLARRSSNNRPSVGTVELATAAVANSVLKAAEKRIEADLAVQLENDNDWGQQPEEVHDIASARAGEAVQVLEAELNCTRSPSGEGAVQSPPRHPSGSGTPPLQSQGPGQAPAEGRAVASGMPAKPKAPPPGAKAKARSSSATAVPHR